MTKEGGAGAEQGRGRAYPLVPLGLGEVRGQAQLGDEGQRLAHGEVGQQAVVLAHVGDALAHQLGGAGLPVNQHLAQPHGAALVPARHDVQQGRLPTAWSGEWRSRVGCGFVGVVWRDIRKLIQCKQTSTQW